MHNNNYLYGEDEVPEIPAEIIVRRVEILEENMRELLKEHYTVRDFERCNAIRKAIDFWENINNEAI